MKLPNKERAIQLPATSVTAMEDLLNTTTITPSKTLISLLNPDPGTYFDAESDLTHDSIGHPLSLPTNIPLEHLQIGEEQTISPTKLNIPSIEESLNELQGVQETLVEDNTKTPSDVALKTKPEINPSSGSLPGIESFDCAVASTKLFNLAAKVANNKSGLSRKEKTFCLFITSDCGAKDTQETLGPVETFNGTRAVEKAEMFDFIGKEVLAYPCLAPGCSKSFSRLSALNKHKKRHEKPYGCTFEKCYGRFGSKADWKRHESMQHAHIQLFRCSLPRDDHVECAKVFQDKEGFVQHLLAMHKAENETIKQQVNIGYIGVNEAKSKFRYWCGFCKEIIEIPKKGTEAYNDRFDHIDLHFQKNENIQRWVPAKGHTEKGAQQRRDKTQRESSTEATSRSRNGCTQKRCNHHDDGQLSEYDDCPSSSDENCSETKPQHRNHGESRKRRKQEHVYGETVSFIYCCQCRYGALEVFSGRSCVECEHAYCSSCQRETANVVDELPLADQTRIAA